MDVSRNSSAPGPEPSARPRGYGRRTALAFLAAFAVSWLCALKIGSFLPLFRRSSWPAVEPFSELFWFYAALAAAPLVAFAAAGLYCRLRARSCYDAPRARRAAVRAPLACAAAWYALPVGAATLSSFLGGDKTWLEGVLSWVSFLRGIMLSSVLAPLATIAALGVLALAPTGGAAPEPAPRRVARRSAAACLAALAFLLVFFIVARPGLLELRYSEQPSLGAGDWALLVGVPLAAFAVAGACGWLKARSCGRRARAVAVLVPLASAAAWLILPAAVWLIMSMRAGYPPAVYLLRSVGDWTDVFFSLLYLALSIGILVAAFLRARRRAGAFDGLGEEETHGRS